MDINTIIEERSYMTVGINEINLIDFSQVLQNNEETIRENNNKTRFLISWNNGEEPSFIPSLQTKSQVYSYDEILIIMDSDDWKSPITETIK
jgi:hypothetical protein